MCKLNTVENKVGRNFSYKVYVFPGDLKSMTGLQLSQLNFNSKLNLKCKLIMFKQVFSVN